jgi:beta-ribofuranosylaminobenzene 5'-phosphate synthase
MLIEIGAPSVLPFGLVRFENKICLLGITLQHPPVHLSAKKYAGYKVSGARGDVGHEFATKFLDFHNLAHQAEVEIELAIPAHLGLGSEAILGLGAAKSLAQLNQMESEVEGSVALAKAIGLKSQHSLELWGFDQGGLLLVETEAAEGEFPAIVRRKEIQHPEREDWAFVLHFPRISSDTPMDLETQRLDDLLKAGSLLDTESENIIGELLLAVENDHLDQFSQSLEELTKLNNQALDASGKSIPLSSEERAILDVMRENGALTCGRSATGFTLYALVKGSSATVSLRHALRDHLGHFGGIAMATITDNHGARVAVKD